MEQISDILFGLYRGTPRHGEWVLACLEGMWPGLLGERLARVCRPTALKNSTLMITVLDPDWEGALRSLEADLLSRIDKASGGEIRVLSFVVDGKHRSDARGQKKKT